MQELNTWAMGDSLQGKIMAGIGLLLALCLYFVCKGNNPILKGMLIPLSLLLIANLGYGSFLAVSRPKHITTTLEAYDGNAQQTLQRELKKAETDSKNYTNLKPVWGILTVVSVGLFFFFAHEYYKGLSLGFLALSFGLLLIDALLHNRLKPYLKILLETTANLH